MKEQEVQVQPVHDTPDNFLQKEEAEADNAPKKKAKKKRNRRKKTPKKEGPPSPTTYKVDVILSSMLKLALEIEPTKT